MGHAAALRLARLGAAALCVASAWAAADVAAPSAPLAGAPPCRVVVPEGLGAGDVRWSGACEGGLASGAGVLRRYEGGRVVRVFYGRFDAGRPAIGVVDLGDGFVAGRYADGRLVRDADRDTLIEAFAEASAAARQMAERLRRAGNAASARYYDDKARQLARQID